ncbi:DUF413 domain-containing protein, partial [Vibrio sp. Vb2880]|nr:DUF413 domain-containing protein [Vibrio sp. Vb2880]
GTWLKSTHLARGPKRFLTLNGRNKPDATEEYIEESLVEDD